MDHPVSMLPHVSGAVALSFLFATAAFLVALARRRASGGQARGGLSIQVTDRAVAHRALVQHSAAFLDRPTGAVVSAILTRHRHWNIVSAPYGPYWRAARRNAVAGVLHSSRVRLLHDTRARALGALFRKLEAGAPIGESLHFAVFCIQAEMCFGEDVVAKLGETRLRAMGNIQRDIQLALPSFRVLVRYPRIGKLLYPSRWRQLLGLRRRQEETFLPLVGEVKNRHASRDGTNDATYVDSLLDLRIPGDGDRAVTDGEIVSLISEFLGAGTESTAAALEWTMANLVKRPELQRKLRLEVDAAAAAAACGERVVIEEADLSRMPYLKAVVLESLRRHPPVSFVVRHVECEEAAKAFGMASLPDGGATVKFLIDDIGRDPAAWSDPMAFTPERFMPGGEGEAPDLTCTRELKMMPFGAGRRVCPGITLATLTMEYFVANLVREFEWRAADGDEVDLAESRGFLFTTMKRPLRARLVPRVRTAAK
ncbi:hypothetical protein ACP70R_009697 [Stipagrostis hirtigluma subsp. patula]